MEARNAAKAFVPMAWQRLMVLVSQRYWRAEPHLAINVRDELCHGIGEMAMSSSNSRADAP